MSSSLCVNYCLKRTAVQTTTCSVLCFFQPTTKRGCYFSLAFEGEITTNFPCSTRFFVIAISHELYNFKRFFFVCGLFFFKAKI